jgi:hypothetical protein
MNFRVVKPKHGLKYGIYSTKPSNLCGSSANCGFLEDDGWRYSTQWKCDVLGYGRNKNFQF